MKTTLLTIFTSLAFFSCQNTTEEQKMIDLHESPREKKFQHEFNISFGDNTSGYIVKGYEKVLDEYYSFIGQGTSSSDLGTLVRDGYFFNWQCEVGGHGNGDNASTKWFPVALENTKKYIFYVPNKSKNAIIQDFPNDPYTFDQYWRFNDSNGRFSRIFPIQSEEENNGLYGGTSIEIPGEISGLSILDFANNQAASYTVNFLPNDNDFSHLVSSIKWYKRASDEIYWVRLSSFDGKKTYSTSGNTYSFSLKCTYENNTIYKNVTVTPKSSEYRLFW